MTQIIYILDGKNLLINEADDSIEKINTKIRNGEWRYPFRFDTPKTFQIDEILVVSGSSKKKQNYKFNVTADENCRKINAG